MLAPVLVLATAAACCVAASHALARARWPCRSPAAAIVLWQALGLGWGLAAVGALAALGTGSNGAGIIGTALDQFARLAHGTATGAGGGLIAALRLAALTAGTILLLLLCWVLIASAAAVARGRQRQHALLTLLAHGDPKAPGALVVDYPAAAAYCLPGLRSAIVLSSATLELLDTDELAAVIEHERAHLRERHDLVLLPFTALLRAFRWSGVAREAHRAVALLVEMHADDRARQHRPARELATALLRFGAAGAVQAPAGTLAASGQAVPGAAAGRPAPALAGRPPAAADVPASQLAAAPDTVAGDLAARVARLLRPAPGLPFAGLALVGAAALLAVAVPVALLAFPL
ncbi:MAG: M56 family metallopeptidase [Streptosporangiaceae bacterium]